MLHGNDVSGYQPDWSPAHDDGFAAIKVTQGTGFYSSSYQTQLGRVRRAGKVAIHYHFMSGASAASQAAWFIRNAKLQPGDGIAVDWEPWNGSTPSNGLKSALIRELQHRAPGVAVGLYVNRSMWYGSDRFFGDFLWIASPGSRPPSDIPWSIWQYDWQPLDVNWARFSTMAAMRAFLTKGKPPTPPTPRPLPPPPIQKGIFGMSRAIGPINGPAKKIKLAPNTDTWVPIDAAGNGSILGSPTKHALVRALVEVSGLQPNEVVGVRFVVLSHPNDTDVRACRQVGLSDSVPGANRREITFIGEIPHVAAGKVPRLRIRASTASSTASIQVLELDGIFE